MFSPVVQYDTTYETERHKISQCGSRPSVTDTERADLNVPRPPASAVRGRNSRELQLATPHHDVGVASVFQTPEIKAIANC